MWRVLVGLHNSIKLSFMTAGHTKFVPDWCFGLLKQKFRQTKVDCLEDIAQVVESSASVNEVQPVGSQSGEVIVKNYDWTGFLPPNFEQVIQIKRQHHFEITITSYTPENLQIPLAKNKPYLKISPGIPKMNFLRKTYQLDSHSRDSGTCMTKLLSSVLIKQETLCVPTLNIPDHQPHREQLLHPPYQLHRHP